MKLNNETPTKAIRNAGKVLNMKLIVINNMSYKFKVWCFKTPHYAQPNRQTVKLPTKANYYRIFSADCWYR